MKQNIDLIDSETGFKFRIESAAEVLTKDITIVVPDDDNAVLATSKQVENLRTGLTNGSITVRNAETVGDKQATDFALNDLSNVDLQGLNIGGNESTMFKIGAYANWVGTGIPAVNVNIPFLNGPGEFNTIDTTQKIDVNTFLLKAGRSYKIEGGVTQVIATGGYITTQFKFYKASDNSSLTFPNTASHFYGYFYGGNSFAFRNYKANGYITPTEDMYVRFQCTNNTLTGSTNYETEVVITEYMTQDIALAGMKINGKSFDNNNNIDLEGLSTLSGYSTNEVLTEQRWIDGKPIYRKVITGNLASPAVDVTINTGLSGISNTGHIINTKIAQSDGLVRSGASSYYVSDTNECVSYYNQVTGVIIIYVSNSNASYANATYQIVLEYTKISDTASSPVRLVGSGNGTAGLVSELPAMVGSEGKLLRVNQNGQLEWFDNSFVGCSVIATVATTVAAGTNTLIKFNDSVNCKVYDTHNAFDFVNSKFIAPVTGYYEVIGKIGVSTTSYNRCNIYKNNVLNFMGGDSAHNHSMVNNVVYLEVGDSISLYGLSTLANTTYGNGNTYLTITLKK